MLDHCKSQPEQAVMPRRGIPALRWWIGSMLLLSTVINYIDRQTLSLLAPYLKLQFHWTNTDYAWIIIAFRITYAIGQSGCGRMLDRLGAKLGLTITVAWYSSVSVLTSLASGLLGFAGMRFLLGAGESGNWPAATKVVSEWFPRQERALATALFDSGSSIGGAITPFLVLAIYSHWGWRPAFMLPGTLGFLWLVIWRRFYHSPRQHPRLSAQELELIETEQQDSEHTPQLHTRPSWFGLLKLPQTWAIIISKSFTDPVWFFVTDWFPIYLIAKGIELRSGLIAIWVPFLAADAGNFLSGWFSGLLIRKGWSVGWARKALIIFGGIGVTALIPTIFTTNLYLIAALFGFATFAYACYSTMANTLPSDVCHADAVASVSGMSGSGAGIGTIIAFWLIGHVSDARHASAVHSFDPIVIVAGIIPLLGVIPVLMLLRNSKATQQGQVRQI